MTKPLNLIAIGFMTLSTAGLLGRASALKPELPWNAEAIMRPYRTVLEQKGLLTREDIQITVSDLPVALGFTRPGCRGTLLMAPLPSSAQSWTHVAPLVDLDEFKVTYNYKGALYKKAPLARRLLDNTWSLINLSEQDNRHVVLAFAETGDCDLIEEATDYLTES